MKSREIKKLEMKYGRLRSARPRYGLAIQVAAYLGLLICAVLLVAVGLLICAVLIVAGATWRW